MFSDIGIQNQIFDNESCHFDVMKQLAFCAFSPVCFFFCLPACLSVSRSNFHLSHFFQFYADFFFSLPFTPQCQMKKGRRISFVTFDTSIDKGSSTVEQEREKMKIELHQAECVPRGGGTWRREGGRGQVFFARHTRRGNYWSRLISRFRKLSPSFRYRFAVNKKFDAHLKFLYRSASAGDLERLAFPTILPKSPSTCNYIQLDSFLSCN